MLKIFYDLAKDILWDDWDNYLTYEQVLLLQLEEIEERKEKLSQQMEESRNKIERIERSNNLYQMESNWLECAKYHYFAALEKNTCVN